MSKNYVVPMSSRLSALALVALGALAASGCNSGNGPGPAESNVAAGLATLTASAASAAGTPATGEAIGDDPSIPPGDAGDALLTQVAATRSAVEATEGIAEVDELVASEPPLATFTPSANDGGEGELLFVRNGRFHTARADGTGAEQVGASELPSVWAPPDDPGRAFAAPNDAAVAFFGGSGAELWLMEPDGGGARRLSGPNLPTGAHEIQFGDGSGSVKLRPSRDYTIVALPDDGETKPALLVDDNSRHIRGEGRLRVVHAAEAASDKLLDVLANGSPGPRPIGYGETTGDMALPSGNVSLEVKDQDGERVALFPSISLADYELKTLFLHGADSVQGAEVTYQADEGASGASRVRVFNAGDASETVRVDGIQVLAADVAPATASSYGAVNAVATQDEIQDLEMAIYGLATGEAPLAWAPDGSKIAFVGAVDGQPDLYLATVDGDVRRLTNDADAEMFPRWSPDSSNLAWTSLDSGFDVHRLFRYSDGDSQPTAVNLEPVTSSRGLAPDAPVRFPKAVGWLNDDTLFFYPSVDNASAGIWTADGEGGANEVYADTISDPEWSREAQAWAVVVPDKQMIVAVSPGGEAVELATGAVSAPLWSPDGKLVSYTEGDKASPDGWVLHVVGSDGEGDVALTDRLPLLQVSPPVPGPEAKRVWLDGGRELGFMRAGRDYGAKERSGGYTGRAGDDIENLWVVPVDGGEEPRRATDLTKAFYVKDVAASPEGDALALVAFSYLDRTQKLWAMATGGKPVAIDSGVRWFMWLR